MDPNRQKIWNMTPAEVDEALRKAGIDPQPALDAIDKLMREKVHHRRVDHPEEMNPMYGSKAA